MRKQIKNIFMGVFLIFGVLGYSHTAYSAVIVTPLAGVNGAISPSTPQTVSDGSSTAFTITPDEHYHITSVTGAAEVRLLATLLP